MAAVSKEVKIETRKTRVIDTNAAEKKRQKQRQQKSTPRSGSKSEKRS
ncbi:hypothetical protein INT80_13395 [Gallibacterium anatis]|uniref:Uncharacterized protein n=1 Tax=Gallibacterium anatis TaxID=750 RepID=A0A930Y929_9PAST|nr:hypothetical protein [Gallibacterium anatis]